MNLVSWNNAIQITKRERGGDTPDRHKLWTDLITPRKSSDLIGNAAPVDRIKQFLQESRDREDRSACLFLHGESGTGKSTTVSVLARDMGFHTVHTYADKQRTPVRLEGVVREAGIYGSSGIVILDDFEIFLSETASLKLLSKFLRGIVKSKSGASRCLLVIISNSTHKLFGSIQEVSTVVEFKRLPRGDMQRVFNRVQRRVRKHSYIPPMAAFFASSSCSGTISQGVQQLQFLYSGNKEPRFVRRPHKKRKVLEKNAISSENNRDCITYLWSDMYTDKMLNHLTDRNFRRERVTERLMAFGKDKLDILSSQIHTEYPSRIAMGNIAGLRKMDAVANAISLSDTNRMEVHEDGLFDGENRDRWSENDINFVTGVTSSVLELKGFEKRDIVKRKKSRLRLTKYTGVGDPQDAFYRAMIERSKR
jgi:hypothetical protein